MKNLSIIIFISMGLFYLSGCCCAIFTANFSRARDMGQLTACEVNMKNIATALEMYGMDNSIKREGKEIYCYPENLGKISPAYMKNLPLCPKCNLAYSYIPSEDKTYYILCCPGNGIHSATGKVSPGNFPQYTPDKGLLEK